MSDGSVREGAPGPASQAGPPGQAAPAADLAATPGVAGSAHPPDDDPPPAANPPQPADSSYWLDLDRSPGSNGTSAHSVPAGHDPKPAAQGRLGGWLAGSRLLVVILAIAVTSALVGGLIGGFVGSRPLTGTQPSYSLGTTAPALTNRPADSVAGIVARVLPSVVMIKVNGDEGTGSGFIISGGYIVTNNHVVTLDGAVSHS